MKAYVYVTLKTTVLDPQGKTIQAALKKMGYRGVNDVRQGKYFVLTLVDDDVEAKGAEERDQSRAAMRAEVERIAREVLTNPVIEEFTCSLEE